MKKAICFILGIVLYSTVNAQMTGSFELSIEFNESDYNYNRLLYYYVPEDYDNNKAYKLIVGFRGGPHSNAGQFRNQLQFLSDSIDAIILCPENIDHFWNQEGLTKQLFQYSVDTTLSMYNIDPNFIYLTGLSFGGRHSVIVSMDSDNGPIPKLRGVIPFAAGSESHLQPNYDNVDDFPPSCICIGLSDSNNFINVSHSLYNNILNSGGTSKLVEISNVGHTVDFPEYPDVMMDCINYIEQQHSLSSINQLGLLDPNILKIEPNPSSEYIRLSLPNNLTFKKLSLWNYKGCKIMEPKFSEPFLDLTSLHNGSYIIIAEFEEGIIKKSIIVSR